MRQRAMERKNEEMEVMEVEEEGKSGEESESESEYEEYTDSEDEAEPRLKPVFIRKYDLSIFCPLLGNLLLSATSFAPAVTLFTRSQRFPQKLEYGNKT